MFGLMASTAACVPTINVSAVDLTFVSERETSIDEINAVLRKASEGELKIFEHGLENIQPFPDYVDVRLG